ncbi:MAG: OmpA family protein [Rhodospirillales bacterium]|nr:OmpA family protein [Rhodospirillales bacterium]
MNVLIRTLVTAAAAVSLAACTTVSSIDRVTGMETGGDAFTRALHTGYVDNAYKEAGFHDWGDAGFFRDKAEKAGMGEAVLPEDPGTWDIQDEAMLAGLNSERARLIGVLDDGGRSEMAGLAGFAQTRYDCWVEEAEEGPEKNAPVAAHQVEELGRCRAAYLAAMEELTAMAVVMTGETGEAAETAMPVETIETVETAMPVETVSEFVVYFRWDRSALSPLAQSFLDDVAAAEAASNPSSVSVSGYTDTSGPADYNMALSQSRANTVANYLVAAGVNPDTVNIGWFGQNDLAVETADGVREPNNRRVEIVFAW